MVHCVLSFARRLDSPLKLAKSFNSSFVSLNCFYQDKNRDNSLKSLKKKLQLCSRIPQINVVYSLTANQFEPTYDLG